MATTPEVGSAGDAPADEHVPYEEQSGHKGQPGHEGSGQAGQHHGYHARKADHLKRLRRIEGQIRGLQRMVEEDVYCIDILTQVSASTKGLQSFALQLLEEHLRHCVADAAVRGGDEIDAKVEEATKAIARMLRT